MATLPYYVHSTNLLLLSKQKYIEYENIMYDKENMFIKFNNIGKNNHVVVYRISKENDLQVSIYDKNGKIYLIMYIAQTYRIEISIHL